MTGHKKIILRVVDDENEFNIHSFINEVTETLAAALSVDDPKVAARVLVDAAVGQWQMLGAHHQEISGHLQRADARVLHRGRKVLTAATDRGRDENVVKISAAGLSEADGGVVREETMLAAPERAESSGALTAKSVEKDFRRDDWNSQETDERKVDGPPAQTADSAATGEADMARIDIDGLKVIAGSAPGMPYRMHVLAPGGDVAKLMSGRGRQQDLEMWLKTAMGKLPQGYGWRLIGQSGEMVSSSKPASA